MPLPTSLDLRLGSAAPSADLAGFARSQRLAYDVAEAVAARLEPGTTERAAAAALAAEAETRGVERWFHVPFAWFGDRTTFPGRWHPGRFFPTSRRLVPGMAFILDLAPVVDGYASDIGYSGVFGANAAWDLLADGLADHRSLILDGVCSGATMAEVYRAVDALAARQGFDPRHHRYPQGVLGHEVGWDTGRAEERVVAGFGVPALRFLGTAGRAARRAEAVSATPPLWNDSAACEVRPAPGLWAVEPHLGFRDLGAKWEELLVVTPDGDAHWLDDDLPHTRRWRQREVVR